MIRGKRENIGQRREGEGGLRRGQTDERGLAGVIDVQQVAVEVEVGVATRLDGGVGGLLGGGAGRPGEAGEDGKGRERDAGDALGGELGLVDEHLLDGRVGGLLPGGGERRHGI